VGLFLAELVRKSVKESSPNEDLFDFLEGQLEYLEHTQDPLQLLPLWSGLKMTYFLGFSPNHPEKIDESMYFDLRDGVLTGSKPFHPDIISPPMAIRFVQLAESALSELDQWQLSRQDRDLLFDRLIDYYKLHIEHLGRLRTPEIFRELF
jgi:DNA repair protein RecO (recombination protein O)